MLLNDILLSKLTNCKSNSGNPISILKHFFQLHQDFKRQKNEAIQPNKMFENKALSTIFVETEEKIINFQKTILYLSYFFSGKILTKYVPRET